MASTVTRRIRRLRDAAERIAEGDLDARADVSGGGEIEELAESFNTMADRVQAVVESQRGFAGDASHQLRTPLTALRLRLDRAADLMTVDEPATDQVDAARDEIDRLQRLVDGLLVLARADRRDQHTVPVDVSAVAAERVADWRALADERTVGIELDTPGMAVALAVPGAVEQIVDNYVDNALEVVPAGSRIVVSVRVDPAGVVLTVDDAGPGLPAEARDRAFDRFWRGAAGRLGQRARAGDRVGAGPGGRRLGVARRVTDGRSARGGAVPHAAGRGARAGRLGPALSRGYLSPCSRM